MAKRILIFLAILVSSSFQAWASVEALGPSLKIAGKQVHVTFDSVLVWDRIGIGTYSREKDPGAFEGALTQIISKLAACENQSNTAAEIKYLKTEIQKSKDFPSAQQKRSAMTLATEYAKVLSSTGFDIQQVNITYESEFHELIPSGCSHRFGPTTRITFRSGRDLRFIQIDENWGRLIDGA